MRVSLDAKLTALSVLLLGVGLSAQQPPPAPAKPDTPDITAMIEAARKAAAPEFADAVHFWCEAPRANRPDDPPIAPTKIFDNVYAIGNSGTTVYVVRTSAGLLMIDALCANPGRRRSCLPGFRALGLDPAQVKIILVTHGHADHFGGASYFQETVRLEGVRLGGRLERDGESAAARAADAGRPVRRAASETRRRTSSTARRSRWAISASRRSPCPGIRPARWRSSSPSRTTARRTWRRCSAAPG